MDSELMEEVDSAINGYWMTLEVANWIAEKA
jgi:hypothetical protein